MSRVSRPSALLRRLGREYSDDPGPLTALVTFLGGSLTIALGLTELWTDAPLGAPGWWHLVPLAIGCAAATVRRSHPAVTMAVAVVVFTADAVIGGSLALLLVLFDAIYASERFGSWPLRRTVRFASGVLITGGSLAAVLAGLPLRTVAALTLQLAAMLLIPIWWAVDVRHRGDLAAAAEARADLEAARAGERARAQDAERRNAVQEERSRMARELHDAVAGDVSALVIRAGAALAQPPGPADRESLAAVRESGLHALDELRSMIEVLTADGEQEPVAPTLTENGADLLARFDVVVDGVRPADLGPLPAGVDRAGYRVLQEALTNAVRHGRPGTASARIRRHGDAVEITVSNAVEKHPEETSGMGLASMTERAQSVGGMLGIDVGEGTWTVTATLPA